jgi:Flp pilus assembly CpaF family ATPase
VLSAAVAARKNLMIAGSTNAGKTTLLRALANEIPAGERLVTVERALELGIDQFPELHPNVVAFEERLPNAEGAGAISMAELVRRSWAWPCSAWPRRRPMRPPRVGPQPPTLPDGGR